MTKTASTIREFSSLDEAFREELRRVLTNGSPVSPRDFSTIEVTDSVFRIRNPRARLVHSSHRKWSLHYAIGELLWHLSGSNSLEFIAYYSDKWRKFSPDGQVITGSSYGHKLFSQNEHGITRWGAVQELLRQDPDSRRGVISLHGLNDLTKSDSSKDIPCCNLLQFLIREEGLCLINYMRSNDLIFGFVYDIFLFTMLQELMAKQLGISVGWYQHNVGSLHVYANNVEWARAIIGEKVSINNSSMPPLDGLEDLSHVYQYEQSLRCSSTVDPAMEFDTHPYWGDLLKAMLFHKLRRIKDFSGMSKVAGRLKGSYLESLIQIFE